MEKKDIIPSKQKTKSRTCISYDKLINCFNDISIEIYCDYFGFFSKKLNIADYRFTINKKQFINKFKDNNYSFLDLMFCFIASCKIQNISILNFLVSSHEIYGQYDVNKYMVSNHKYNNISENDIVKNRQLFTLGFLSLLKDYFIICDKHEIDNTEQLLVNLFEDIFLDDHELINDFKKTRQIKLSCLSTVEIINNICIKHNRDINEINEVKEKILDYYIGFLLDGTISKENRVKYFVNWCDNELMFNFNTIKMECDVNYNESDSSETIIEFNFNDMQNQQQFYQNLCNIDDEINEFNYKTKILFPKK